MSAAKLTTVAAEADTAAGGSSSDGNDSGGCGKTSPTSPTMPQSAGGDGAAAARQLAKLRRFLGTLVQFGADISPDVGDRVRDLVIRLLNSSVTVEEFHSELHIATNYPLRPFVIPFLRASLPLMQCELLHRSRVAGQSPSHFLAEMSLADFLQQEQHQLPPATVGGDIGKSGCLKRRASADSNESSDRVRRRGSAESVANGNPSPPPSGAAAGAASQSPSSTSLMRQLASGAADSHQMRLHQVHPQHPQQPLCRAQRQRRSLRQSRSRRTDGAEEPEESGPDAMDDAPEDNADAAEDQAREVRGAGEADRTENDEAAADTSGVRDEWRRLEAMLAAVADLVARARKSLAGLQNDGRQAASLQQQQQQPQQPQHQNQHQQLLAAASSSLSSVAAALIPLHESNTRRRRSQDGDAVKARIQQQQQQQHLDDLVSAIRRQAQQEVRLAVAAAEARAAELLSAEKLRTERLLALAREETLATARVQTSSAESCWNCGRIASETCSGCSTARYCGSFCQHKDWDRHQKACRPQPMTQDSLVDSSRLLLSSKSDRR